MIIINARFLTQKITGVQRVGIEWSKILKKSDLNICFLTPKNIIHQELANTLGAKVVGNLKGHLWEQIDLYRHVKKNPNAILISFGFTGPIFYKNQIITIYDLGFRKHPEWFSWKFRIAYNLLIPLLSKKVKYILTDSQVIKEEIIAEYSIDPNKVFAIHLGVSNIFLREGKKKKSISDNENYILTVSSHHPRKNYQKLIEAFNLIEDKSIKLYVVGNVVSHFANSFDIDLIVEDRIVFLTDVGDEELVNYYRNAKLFVFPSLYEGFGIPIIEAMSQAIPCVVSDIPVFREICGDKADFFDPNNALEIASVINFRLKHPDSMEILEKRKEEVINTFTWKSGATQVMKVLSKSFGD